MKIKPLQIGLPHENIEALEKIKLTKYSPREAVMTENAIKLLNANASLAPSSFERFRAKAIGVIVGASLPIAIGAIFGGVIYALYRAGTLARLFIKAQVAVSALATKIFTAMTASKPALAASAGGAVAGVAILTRPGVYEAISSFVGSLFGSLTGSSLATAVHETQNAGYDWWVNKYRFAEREKSIQSNQETIITILTDAYNDMAADLNESREQQKHSASGREKLKAQASLLKDRVKNIHVILQKQGIPYNKTEEITLQFDKAIARAQ